MCTSTRRHADGDWLCAAPSFINSASRLSFTYCVQVTLKQRLRALAPGLTPAAVLEKFAAMQMVDVHVPTTDGRHLVLSRQTQPDQDQKLLLQEMKLELPEQPPPKITASHARAS